MAGQESFFLMKLMSNHMVGWAGVPTLLHTPCHTPSIPIAIPNQRSIADPSRSSLPSSMSGEVEFLERCRRVAKSCYNHFVKVPRGLPFNVSEESGASPELILDAAWLRALENTEQGREERKQSVSDKRWKKFLEDKEDVSGQIESMLIDLPTKAVNEHREFEHFTKKVFEAEVRMEQVLEGAKTAKTFEEKAEHWLGVMNTAGEVYTAALAGCNNCRKRKSCVLYPGYSLC